MSLKYSNDKELQNKYKKEQMKPFVCNLGNINERQYLTETVKYWSIKINDKDDNFVQNLIKYTIQNSRIPEEKPAKCVNQNRQVLDENPAKVINYWHTLPKEIEEKMLLRQIKCSDHICQTYNNIIKTTCTLIQMIK